MQVGSPDDTSSQHVARASRRFHLIRTGADNMIIIDAHGLYPVSNPGPANKTWVPEGMEVWFYTGHGSALSSAQAVAILANLPDLPTPRKKFTEGMPLYNHNLFSHGDDVVAARRMIIPDTEQNTVIYKVPSNIALCTDPLGACSRRGKRNPPVVHTCSGVLNRFTSVGRLVLLICRGPDTDEVSASYNELIPPRKSLWEPGYPEGARAFRLATTTGFDDVGRFKERLRTSLKAGVNEGDFAACRHMGGYAVRYTAPNSAAANDPWVQKSLEELENRRLRVVRWMSYFDRDTKDKDEDEDPRIAKVVALSEQELAHAIVLNAKVGEVVGHSEVAMLIATSILERKGPLSLLLHYRTASPVAQESIDGTQGLARTLRGAQQVLDDFDVGDHTHRLTTWLALSAAERSALRELVWRPDSDSEEARAWIREAQSVLRAIRAHVKSGSVFAVLHHTTRIVDSWDQLWKVDSRIDNARTSGLNGLRAFEASQDGRRFQLWNRYSAEDQRLLTLLSPTVHEWSRRGNVIRAQAAAAFDAGGDLGLLAFLREPDQEWRLEARFPSAHSAARARAEDLVEQLDAAAPRAKPVTEPAISTLSAYSPADQERLCLLSSGARRIKAAIATFDRELFRLAKFGTPTELWTFWGANAMFHSMVRADTGKYGNALTRVRSVETVMTSVLPALADLDNFTLITAYSELPPDQQADVAAMDTRVGQELAGFLESPPTTDDEDFATDSDEYSDASDADTSDGEITLLSDGDSSETEVTLVPEDEETWNSGSDNSAESEPEATPLGAPPEWVRRTARVAVGRLDPQRLHSVAHAQTTLMSDADHLVTVLRTLVRSTTSESDSDTDDVRD
jgi:hypothetical protein